MHAQIPLEENGAGSWTEERMVRGTYTQTHTDRGERETNWRVRRTGRGTRRTEGLWQVCVFAADQLTNQGLPRNDPSLKIRQTLQSAISSLSAVTRSFINYAKNIN